MKQMGKMAMPELSWRAYHESRKTMSTTVSRYGGGLQWFEEQQTAATLADPGHLLAQLIWELGSGKFISVAGESYGLRSLVGYAP